MEAAPHDWETTARTQAARADHMEDLLRQTLDLVAVIENTSFDASDDRLTCEDCHARGWPIDGFTGDGHLAFCEQHA